MVFEMTLANVITVLALFVMALWALVKVIDIKQEKIQNQRFKALGEALEKQEKSQNQCFKTQGEALEAIAKAQKDNTDALHQLECQFLQQQLEIAKEYVRRDDFVRHIGTLETRIDNFALRVERALNNQGDTQ